MSSHVARVGFTIAVLCGLTVPAAIMSIHEHAGEEGQIMSACR